MFFDKVDMSDDADLARVAPNHPVFRLVEGQAADSRSVPRGSA
jgi:hypothetical protein